MNGPLDENIFRQHTWTTVSTVTKMTDWRFIQIVDVEATTVAYTDIVTPITALAAPVIAYFASDHSLGLGGMRALHPARSVGSTIILSYTFGGHSRSRRTREAVPAFGEIILIALEYIASCNTHRSVTCIQCLVAFTFCSK